MAQVYSFQLSHLSPRIKLRMARGTGRQHVFPKTSINITSSTRTFTKSYTFLNSILVLIDLSGIFCLHLLILIYEFVDRKGVLWKVTSRGDQITNS